MEMWILSAVDICKTVNQYWYGKGVLRLMDKATPLKETWDAVAGEYSIEIEKGEFELAAGIADILIKQGILPNAEILELGCGSGHLSAVLAMKGYKTTLLDFSTVSLEKAKQTYAYYGVGGEFICADILNLNGNDFAQYALVWNSGVMEHFNDASIINAFHSIQQLNADNLLLLVPNPESIAYLLMRHVRMAKNDWPYGEEYLRTNFEEVISSFGYENIIRYYLGDSITKHCFNTALADSQFADSFSILLDNGFLPDHERYLISYFASKRKDVILKDRKRIIQSETENITKIFNLNAEIYGLKKEIEQFKQTNNEIDDLKKILLEKNNIIDAGNTKIAALNKDISDLQNSINSLNEKLQLAVSEKDFLENINTSALAQCYSMLKNKSFKLVHALYRFKMQLLKGSLKEKREFINWLINRNCVYNEHKYNPLYHIINKLENKRSLIESFKKSSTNNNEALNLNYDILNYKYSKYDVIVLSIIDYNFRFQRPQHFAKLYADNGHRVFYINAGHHVSANDTIEKIQDNLYGIYFSNAIHPQIYQTDWNGQEKELFSKIDNLIQANFIRDAVALVEYPNWIKGAEYLRSRYGFKIITDYMDDFTGFINPNEQKIKENCVNLLQLSDFIIASSQFLFDIAKKYNKNVAIVRNGTEYDHFHSVFEYTPYNNRKIIGYYGAVAEWFDVEKVCFAAEKLPDCDFIIIGEVTSGKEKLIKYKNIKLLGEQPYRILPDYLKEFDVCLIPFDTSTDLIKATNPVKFYEYLSAGKKVVATNIPELMPYRNKYVYLADTNEEFVRAIKSCLNGDDTLASAKECAEFAFNNSWKSRFDEIYGYIKKAVPLVSIIVLTYNNLEYNKLCIESILEKTAYQNYELIIVDNNSTDGTREYLNKLIERKTDFLKVYLNNENIGFAGGNNLGIKNSSGKYVLLLNNDTIVSRGWVTSLVKHLEQNPDLGMIGPVTNSIGNEAKINANYNNIEEMNRFAYNYTLRHINERFENPRSLPMFCIMIKTDVIHKCGLLDENYKIGMFEDDDYAESVRTCGYRLAIAEDSFIHHFDGGSFKSLDDEKYREIFETNKKIFEKKWNKKWVPHKYREGVNAEYKGRIEVEINE